MSPVAYSAGWSLAASMALALAILLLRDGRRRSAINEALHELRRPLQAISLTDPRRGAPAGGLEGSVRLAATALERLDRTVNGAATGPPPREVIRGESLLRASVGRWRARVALGGGSLELRWWAGEATLAGDRDAVERAVDNLIVNAIEHGGPSVLVEGRRHGPRLLISVADSGRRAPREARPEGLLLHAGALGSRGRRGHGLAIVRRVAAEHGGRFMLHRAPAGSTAVLELPLAVDPAAAERAGG